MSKGFHRLPSDQPWDNRAIGGYPLPVHKGAIAPLDMVVAPLPAAALEMATFSPGPAKMDRAVARQQGFTGDACTNCGSMRMKISGHCMVCEECGTTTGCS